MRRSLGQRNEPYGIVPVIPQNAQVGASGFRESYPPLIHTNSLTSSFVGQGYQMPQEFPRNSNVPFSSYQYPSRSFGMCTGTNPPAQESSLLPDIQHTRTVPCCHDLSHQRRRSRTSILQTSGSPEYAMPTWSSLDPHRSASGSIVADYESSRGPLVGYNYSAAPATHYAMLSASGSNALKSQEERSFMDSSPVSRNCTTSGKPTLAAGNELMSDGSRSTRATYIPLCAEVKCPSCAASYLKNTSMHLSNSTSCSLNRRCGAGSRTYATTIHPAAVGSGLNSPAEALNSAEVHLNAGLHNLQSAPITRCSSQACCNACINHKKSATSRTPAKVHHNHNRDVATAKIGDYVNPNDVFNPVAIAGASPDSTAQAAHTSATKTERSKTEDYVDILPSPLSTLPRKRVTATDSGQPSKRRVSESHGKATEEVDANKGEAPQGANGCQGTQEKVAKSSHRRAASAGSLTGQESKKTRRSIARKRSKRTSKRIPCLSVGRGKRKSEVKKEVNGINGGAIPKVNDPSSSRGSDKTAVASQTVRVEQHSTEKPEPLVPLAVLPAKVCIPRRVPYPRPIAREGAPPADEFMEDGDVAAKGIAKRFGEVDNGYVLHARSGWLMHPSFYEEEHPLCEMKWICRHSRNCHQIRKRMAIFSCMKQGISYREAEFVWGVSRSCIQRNTIAYKKKVSLDFLLTPSH